MNRPPRLLLEISIALVILLIPFRPLYGSYTLILFAIACFWHALVTKTRPDLPRVLWYLIAMYLIRAIWLILASDKLWGLRVLETELPMLLVPLLFSLIPVTNEVKNVAVKAYAIMAIGIMLYAFLQLILYFQHSPYPFLEYTLIHLNPRWFWETSRYFSFNMLTWSGAHYSFITVILIYGLHLVVYNERHTTTDRVLAILYPICLGIFLIYSGSRIGVLCAIAAIAVYVINSPRVQGSPRLIAALIGFIVAVFIWSMVNWGERIDPKRYHFMAKAVNAWKMHPLLGFGTGAGLLVMHDPVFESRTQERVNHPHNQFLSELIQFGAVGSVVLVTFIVSAFAWAFARSDKALVAVMSTALVFMLTEAPLNSNKGLLPFVFIVSLLVAHNRTSVVLGRPLHSITHE